MCLINELARYNKIQHQYRLTDESGPPHKKTFTVCLKLGDTEEYIASGPSIKKAQHAAAAIALEKTKLKHPPPKSRLVKNSKILFFILNDRIYNFILGFDGRITRYDISGELFDFLFRFG